MRRMAELEQGKPPAKPITEATGLFDESISDLSDASRKKYKRVVRTLEEFARGRGIVTVDGITLESLDAYKAQREVSPLTWSKELPIVRQFLSFCVDRAWMADNPAKRLKMPRNAKPKEVQPYTSAELIRMLAAADRIGRAAYERARAKALTLLFRHTALRISDVAVLEKSRVRDGEVFIRAEKNGKPVWLPVPAEVQAALANLPEPRGAAGESKYFFWSGHGTKASAIRDVRRTMEAVFREAEVKHAHPHRFRHTLAVEVLVSGGTFEDVASILGDSPATIRKHYAPWSRGRQERIRNLMQTVQSGTSLAQTIAKAATC